jgi:cbb3-type cytochrome oxidase subunit 3
MFTGGRLAFTLVFLLVFIGYLVWSFRKDKVINKTHYPKAYKTILGLIFILFALYLIVKLRKFL